MFVCWHNPFSRIDFKFTPFLTKTFIHIYPAISIFEISYFIDQDSISLGTYLIGSQYVSISEDNLNSATHRYACIVSICEFCVELRSDAMPYFFDHSARLYVLDWKLYLYHKSFTGARFENLNLLLNFLADPQSLWNSSYTVMNSYWLAQFGALDRGL